MRVTITTQPAALLTHADAVVRQSLALSGTDRDAQVDALLLAAQAELDGPKGWVGISVAQQSVEVVADAFDAPLIRLPGGPIDIDSVAITYLDGAGNEQTLASGYLVASDGTVTLASGASWPSIYDQAGAVTVAYDVGMTAGDPRISLMKTAIILHAKMTLDFDDVEVRRRAIEGLVRSMWVPML